METKIIKIKSKEWEKFQACLNPGPCVNKAFPSGSVYGLFVVGEIPVLASMVWYTYPFFHTNFRKDILPEIRCLSEKEQITFLNKNVRLLARISTLLEFRGQGFAYKLISETLPLLNVKYIECLTAWPDVRRLLNKLGFVKLSETKGKPIDYWLKTLLP